MFIIMKTDYFLFSSSANVQSTFAALNYAGIIKI